MNSFVLRRRKCSCKAILTVLVICILFTVGRWNTQAEESHQDSKKVDVVFTHDLHSYLDETVQQDKRVGGMARLSTFLKQRRSQNPDTLVVDGGDFTMGTLYHTVFSTEAIEYRMLGVLDFDATTLGNHEFDFGTKQLKQMINRAKEVEPGVPPILDCNIDWELPDTLVVTKGDVRIGITGVLGKDALECSPTCDLTVHDPIASVKKAVQKLKEQKVDMIVCLSHGGTWSDTDKSEDEILAKKVPEIDLIVSGHTHSTLVEPIKHGNTAIVSCGAYGKNTGAVSFIQNEQGRWSVSDYEVVSMDETIAQDEEVLALLASYQKTIDHDYLEPFGYSANQVIAHTPFDFESLDQMEGKHTEHALGNLMSDSYRYYVNSLEGQESKVDVAVVPAGVIRGTFSKGDITVKQVFESFSLGNGPDGVVGYPLIRIYLTGEELRTLAEVDASISDFMTTARLYMSGLCFTFHPKRMILDKVTKIRQNPELRKDSGIEVDNDKLYCVVADLYSGRMLSAVSSKSFGILKLVPKTKDGKAVSDFEDCIIHDTAGNEVKAWIAIARYLESFSPNAQGISEIPEYYSDLHDRKAISHEKGLFVRIKNPGKYALMIYGILALLLLIIVGIILLIRKRRKKRIQKKSKRGEFSNDVPDSNGEG